MQSGCDGAEEWPAPDILHEPTLAYPPLRTWCYFGGIGYTPFAWHGRYTLYFLWWSGWAWHRFSVVPEQEAPWAALRRSQGEIREPPEVGPWGF